jgi:uncharacterized phage-like protein YoqJ
MEPKITACFSGHRPQKLDSFAKNDYDSLDDFRESVRVEILKAIDMGYKSFICGMAMGFDLICGSLVVEIKAQDKFRDIQLVAAMPFPKHGTSSHWSEDHKLVLSKADKVEIVCPTFSRQAYLARDRYMVDCSSLLICYFLGLPGGTAYTVKYAAEKGLRIINLASNKKPETVE